MGKDTIRALNTRQQCREKLPIFFGSRDNYVHGTKEAIANAIDEISNNYENGEIYVELNGNRDTVSVRDTGRGIPINKVTDGIPNYQLLFETLFAGTNFDNSQNDKVAVGTNGCGTCVLNHTSSLFKVTSAREGEIFELIYTNGGEFQSFKSIGKTDETYSIFEFKLDDDVYSNIIYNADELNEICKYNAAVNAKVTINFIHNDTVTNHHYDSIHQYFLENTEDNTCKPYAGYEKLYEKEVTITYNDRFSNDIIKRTEKNTIQCVISASATPTQQTFLNSNYLIDGGTINRGMIYGIRDYVNKHLTDNKLFDKKLGEITHSEIEEGVSFVATINSTNVEYENQTKLATTKSLYREVAKEHAYEILHVFKTEQPKEFEKFINHILEIQKFNRKAMASKNALKKKLSEKIDNLINRIEALIDCKLHGKGSELFIAEGKSALGSIILARNPLTQAGIAIRGKILNCLKADYDTIFGSDTITDIIKALGCGIETDRKNKDLGSFDKRALRYEKIILAADADPDGYQIVCLLLTMFYRLCPTLIREGHIFIALTPLFEIKDLITGENHYAYSEEEKEEIISKLTKYRVQRNKGLGEVDADVMAATGVNPDTRNIMEVTYEDAERMIRTFEEWMGKEVDMRKQYIETDLNKYEAEM